MPRLPFVPRPLALVPVFFGLLPLSSAEPGGLAPDEKLIAGFETLDGVKGLTQDMNNSRRGKYTGLWEDTVGVERISIKSIPRDVTGWKGIRVFIHATGPGGTIAFVLKSENDADPEGSDYYQYLLPINWQQWKEVEIPFDQFTAKRKPLGLNQVDELRIASSGFGIKGNQPGMVLKFDELRLYGGKEAVATPTPEATPADLSFAASVKTLEEAAQWASKNNGGIRIEFVSQPDAVRIESELSLILPVVEYRVDAKEREDLAILFGANCPSYCYRYFDKSGRRIRR